MDARSIVDALLRQAYSSAGRPPDALLEEDFLAAEAADITSLPSALECCRIVHKRCVLDAVNEALEALRAEPPQGPRSAHGERSRSNGIAALLAEARERRAAGLSVDELITKVMAQSMAAAGSSSALVEAMRKQEEAKSSP